MRCLRSLDGGGRAEWGSNLATRAVISRVWRTPTGLSIISRTGALVVAVTSKAPRRSESNGARSSTCLWPVSRGLRASGAQAALWLWGGDGGRVPF